MRQTTDSPRTVRDLMTNDMVTLSATDTVEEAKNLMLTMAIHAIPVLAYDGAPVGIVTTTDLVDEWTDNEILADVMTEGIVTIDEDASLSEAAQTMKANYIHHLLVTQGRQPVGILSTFDLLDASFPLNAD